MIGFVVLAYAIYWLEEASRGRRQQSRVPVEEVSEVCPRLSVDVVTGWLSRV